MSELNCGKEQLLRLFKKRDERSHKGMFGRVFMLCGSYSAEGISMSGAAVLSARAAYRTGSGIVQVCTPRENYAVVSSCVPEAIYSLYNAEDPNADRLLRDMQACDTLLAGCGLGRGKGSQKILEVALRSFQGTIILDADALNILAESPRLWRHVPQGRVIITPHPGEMSSLCGSPISEILKNTVCVAKRFAKDHGVICVLKDHNTVITDGDNVYVNHSGNAGMATAGSGDVLSGIISSLVSQKRSERADLCSLAAAGVYLHGLAGDKACEKFGEYSLMAGDIVEAISDVIMIL